jgi:integrase
MIILDQKRQAVTANSRVHLEMDEVEELLELARKTDPRSWCILTLAFNHGLRVSECAGGAPAIEGRNRPAIPPLTLSDIDMKHRTIRVRRLKGSLETTQAFVEHRGKPALSDYACLKAYLAVRTDDGSGLLFTGQKGPLHRWALNRMFAELLKQVSDGRVTRGLHPIPKSCFRFHTLKHSVATIIANRVQNIFTLKNHLGHSSISSSMAYSHPDPRTTAAQVQHALSIAFSGF